MPDPAALYAQLTAAFDQRAWQRAVKVASDLLPLAPGHAGVHYIAGIAHLELRQMAPALDHLQRATSLDPGRTDFAVQWAKALSLAHRSAEATSVADRVLAMAPSHPITLDTLGVIYTQAGDYASASSAFRQAVALAPDHASFRYNLATSLIAAGDLDAAEAELEACLERDPRYWLAYVTLSQLRRQTPERNHVKTLEAVLRQADGQAGSEATMCVNMALFKEYEDLGDFRQAFRHLERGKAAGAARRHYVIEQDEAMITAIAESFPGRMADTTGYPTEEPIFVVGMPRSGTTLVERIISSHPQVHAAGELLNFPLMLKQASGSQTAALIDVDTIARARSLDWARLGQGYLSSTRPATGHTARFLDKLPHNFLYAGFIASALPQARIICLRRNPLDTCLSNYRQLFGHHAPFFGYSFDLLDTGRYFILFDRLMRHWHHVLPGRILEVNYEDLVDAPEASTRKLLEFCGLPWHADCVHFERNRGPVATASAVQVRAPMNRSALQRWRNYEPELTGLRALLRDAGIVLPT